MEFNIELLKGLANIEDSLKQYQEALKLFIEIHNIDIERDVVVIPAFLYNLDPAFFNPLPKWIRTSDAISEPQIIRGDKITHNGRTIN